MADNFFDLSAEAHADFSELITGFDDSVKAAERFEGSLGELGSALSNYFNLAQQSGSQVKNIISGDMVKDLSATLDLYKQMSQAVKAYASALSSLNTSDGQGAVEKFSSALSALRAELGNVREVDKDQRDGLRETLALYKQVAEASRAMTGALKSEASAKAAITGTATGKVRSDRIQDASENAAVEAEQQLAEQMARGREKAAADRIAAEERAAAEVKAVRERALADAEAQQEEELQGYVAWSRQMEAEAREAAEAEQRLAMDMASGREKAAADRAAADEEAAQKAAQWNRQMEAEAREAAEAEQRLAMDMANGREQAEAKRQAAQDEAVAAEKAHAADQERLLAQMVDARREYMAKLQEAAHEENAIFDRKKAEAVAAEKAQAEDQEKLLTQMVGARREHMNKLHDEAIAEDAARSRAAQEARTAEQSRLDAAVRTAEGELNGIQRTRYALYEVANAYTVAATAAGAFGTVVAKSAIEYEAQFAQVMRTTQATDAEGRVLRDTFMELSTTIPIAFDEFARIGTLGAQMNIATADLDEFAEVIAKFSATTDVSVEAASVGFGRLASMMRDLDASHFINAASAISELGTASVATESEILTTAESIATTANMAGFTTEEVLGLATALTSLKVRPELARGGLQRIFAEINKSVGEGGEQLQRYADVLGITAEQASNMWRTDPSQFFQRLAAAVRDVSDNVERQNMIRNELGITNSRDVEVLSRLANGYDVYAQSMDLASQSYASGTYLDEEAQVIFEKTAAALQKLSNAFKNMLANLGGSTLTPITAVADVLIRLFDFIGSIPSEVVGVAAVVAALGAGFLAYQAIMFRVQASMFAFAQAQVDMGMGMTTSLAGVRALKKELREKVAATIAARDAAEAHAASMVKEGAAASGAATSNNAVATSTLAAGTAATGARGAFGKLWGSMKAHPIMWIVGGLSILSTVVSSVYDRIEKANEKAAQATDEYLSSIGGAKGLYDALIQDQREFADGTQDIEDANGRIAVGYAAATAATEDNAETIQDILIPSYDEAGNRIDANVERMKKSTTAIQANTLAIGKNADAKLKEAYSKQEYWNTVDLEAMIADGFDMEALYNKLSDNGRFGEAGAADGRDYVDSFIQALEDENDRLIVQMGNMQNALHDPLAKGGLGFSEETLLALEAQVVANNQLIDSYAQVRDGISDTGLQLTGMNNQAIVAAAVMGDLDAVVENNGGSFKDTADAAASLREALSGVVDEAFALIDAEAGLNAALDSLGESIAENGTSFSTSTAEGRANLEALQSTMQATAEMFVSEYEAGNITAQQAANGFAQYIDELMLGLEQLGVDTSQFDALRLHLDELFRDEIHVQVGTAAAIGALYDLQGVAEETWALLRQGDGWGAYFGTDSAWQNRNRNRSNTPTSTPTGRSGIDAVRDAYNRANNERANDNAKKLADEQKRAADEAERHAKAVEDLEKQISDVHKEIAEINDEGRIFEEIVKRTADEMNRVFDENYGLMQATDAMELSLIKMRDNVQANVDKVKDLREEYHKLRREAAQARVDERQARLFQSIARMYGDTERDISYGAEAAEAAAVVKEKENLAAAAKKEADEIDKNRLSLTGYSEQAITNRGDLVDLQQQMVKMIEEYAKTGATTEEVTEYTERLRRKFIDQATQMGYNEQDVRDLAGVFDDLITVINEVPRDVRIEVDADTAAARAKLRQLTNELEKERTVPVTFRSNQQELTVSGDLRVSDIIAQKVDTPIVVSRGGSIGSAPVFMSRGGVVPGGRPADNFFDNMLATTGSRLINLQSGEGIVTNRAMDYYGGKDFIDAVNNRQYPRGGGYSVTQVFTGPEQIRIAPDQIDELARKVSMIVGIDGRTVANTANRYNVSATNRGQ